jgi:hypothetical protein
MNIIEKKLNALETKKELMKKVFTYLPASRMSLEEKKMRVAMLPHMEIKHIQKLADTLEREVNDYTNLYIKQLAVNK